jgi:hypothetical protein
MKRQTVTVLEQSHKFSDREQVALRQAQEALELKEAASANSTRSAQHESYMLDLMTDASVKIWLVWYFLSYHFLAIFLCSSLCYIAFSLVSRRFVSRRCR